MKIRRMFEVDFWRGKNVSDLSLATIGAEEIEVARKLRSTFKTDLENFVAMFGNRKVARQPLEIATKRYFLKDCVKRVDKLFEKLVKANRTFEDRGNVIIQDATALAKYPSRYIASVLYGEGGRFPFTVKRFSTMIQVAANPELEDKDNIDLVSDMKDALTKIQDKHETKENGWAWQIIWEDMGGHRCISTMTFGVLTTAFMRKIIKEKMTLDNFRDMFKVIFSVPEIEKLNWEIDKYGITSKIIKTTRNKLSILERRIKNMFPWQRRRKFTKINAFLKHFESIKEEAREQTRIIREELIEELISICNQKYSDKRVSKTIDNVYLVKPIAKEYEDV